MQSNFNDYLDNYAETTEITPDDKSLLEQLMKEGLDYEKYDLNPKQVLFAVYYVFHTGNNAYQAAIRAGYSEHMAKVSSSWVRGKRQNPMMMSFIGELVSSFGASPTQIVGFLTYVMQADFWGVAIDFKRDQATGEVVKDDSGEPISFINLDKVKRAGLMPMIKSIRRMRGEIQHIELHDALKAAQLLGETHGMYKKHVEINNLSDAIKDAGISEDEAQTIKNKLKTEAKLKISEKRLAQQEPKP